MVGNYKIEIDFTLVDFFTLLRTDKLDIITGLQFHGWMNGLSMKWIGNNMKLIRGEVLSFETTLKNLLYMNVREKNNWESHVIFGDQSKVIHSLQ